MAITLTLARHGLRRQRGSLALLATVVLVSGAVALGCLAAARRSASAHERYLTFTDTADLGIGESPACGDRPCTVADFAAIDGVATVTSAHLLFAIPEGADGALELDDGEQSAFVGLGEGPVWALDRPLVEAGRLPDADASDEVFVDRAYATGHGLEAGDVLRLRAYTSEEAQKVFDDLGQAERLGTSVVLRVTGVGRAGADLESTGGGAIYAPPPTAGRFLPINTSFALQLSEGAEGAEDVARAIEERWGIEVSVGGESAHDRAQRAMRPYITALSAYAAVAAVIGLLLIGQAAARQSRALADEQRTMRAIGLTRRQLRSAGLVGAMVPALAGAAVGAAIAWVTSGWGPVGPVRPFEPAPGIVFDGLVLGLGAVVWAVLATSAGAVGALFGSRPMSSRPARGDGRLTSSLPVSVSIAVRFMRPRAVGGVGVPTRAAVVGLATIAFVVSSVVTFAAGLERLVDTPRLYGWGNDASIFLGYQSTDADRSAGAADVERVLRAEPSVEAVTVLSGTSGSAEVDGIAAPAIGSSGGGALHTIVAGRPPAGDDEIVLGTRTWRRTGVSLGDRVDLDVDGAEGSYTVVGRAVIAGTRGDGAWLTSDGMSRIAPDAVPFEVDVRFVPGTTHRQGAEALTRAVETLLRSVPDPEVVVPTPPEEATRLIAIDGLPLALGVALVLAALLMLAHALLLALRARRHDFATLRACGYRRRQVWATTLVQAVLVVAVGLAVGLPLGTAFGRWLWATWARDIGVVDTPVVPTLFLVAIVPSAIVIAALVACAPASAASRQRVATVLRAE